MPTLTKKMMMMNSDWNSERRLAICPYGSIFSGSTETGGHLVLQIRSILCLKMASEWPQESGYSPLVRLTTTSYSAKLG